MTNRKTARRKGKVQLIDAASWYRPLRKNLGKKNCELSAEGIERIIDAFLRFEETPESKLLDNASFGYWKVTVERPLRATGLDGERAYTPKEIKAFKSKGQINDNASPVIRKILNGRDAVADPLRGRFVSNVGGKPCVVEYEPNGDVRDTEQIPLLEPGGMQAFMEREVYPYISDAWIDDAKTQVGYEINFSRYFYKPPQLRSLEAIQNDIVAVGRETVGVWESIVGNMAR